MAAGRNVSINCTVQGERMDWIINGEHPTVERNQKLHKSGVHFSKGERVNGVWNSRIVIPATLAFNRTLIKCVAENISDTLDSSEAFMIIAGIYTIA